MKEDISSITTSLLTFCFHSHSTGWSFGAKGFMKPNVSNLSSLKIALISMLVYIVRHNLI